MPSSNTQIEQNVSQQQTAYVDAANGDDATGQIGTHKAFKTIQAAINSVPAYSTPAEQRRWWQILVAPGTYDEALVVDTTRRKIAIFGVFNLGLFDGSAWGATNNRNITVRQTAGNIESHRHSFMLGSHVPQGEAITTHPGYMGVPRISGKIILDDTAIPGGTTADFYLNCEVFDQAATGVSLDGTSKAGGANIYLHRARMRTGVSGSMFLLQKAERCRFDGDVSIRSYSRLQDNYFAGNFTCTVVPTPDVEPYGFINCTFASSKVVTTPALGFVLDAVTDYWFTTRSCTLGGAATKVVTEGAYFGSVVWDDVQMPGTSLSTGANVRPPAMDRFRRDAGGTSEGVWLYKFNRASTNPFAGQTKELFFTFQIPHGYKRGENIKFHVHFSPGASTIPAGNVVAWKCEYTVGKIGGPMPVTVVADMSYTAPVGGVAAYDHILSGVATIPGSGLEESSVLCGRLYRDAAAGGDTWADDNAFLLSVDLHVPMNKVGTRLEGPPWD